MPIAEISRRLLTSPLLRVMGEEKLARAAWLSARSRVHARTALRPQVACRVRGTLHGTDVPLTVLAIGPPGFEGQLGHLFLDGDEKTECLGEVGRLGDPLAWRSAEDDVVAQVRRRPWLQPAPGEVKLALALDARITLNGSPEAYVTQHLAKDHLRAWKQRAELGLDYTHSASAADLRRWYHELHVPLIRSRHGAHAYLPPLHTFEARLARTEVLIAHCRGEPVAGVLLEHDPWCGTLTCTAAGAAEALVDDNKRYKQVSVALDYRSLERTHERKIPHFSLGFTLARADGGLFAYKRRWGAAFIPDLWSLPASVSIRPDRKAEVLSRVSLITQAPEGAVVMTGVTGDDDRALEGLRDRIKLCSFQNASRILVHAAPEHAARVTEAVAKLQRSDLIVETVVPG
jgi:hypothetical protein